MTLPNPYHRSDWPRLWSALPAAELKARAATLAKRYPVTDLTLPETGLGLLQLRDSALNEAYFLGEVPLARAHVRLDISEGGQAEGAAQVLDDRASLARALAILDAALAACLPGSEIAADLLRQGAARIAEQDAERRALLAATRVDFALLGGGEEDDDE